MKCLAMVVTLVVSFLLVVGTVSGAQAASGTLPPPKSAPSSAATGSQDFAALAKEIKALVEQVKAVSETVKAAKDQQAQLAKRRPAPPGPDASDEVKKTYDTALATWQNEVTQLRAFIDQQMQQIAKLTAAIEKLEAKLDQLEAKLEQRSADKRHAAAKKDLAAARTQLELAKKNLNETSAQAKGATSETDKRKSKP